MRNLHCMRLQHAYTVYSFFVYLALNFKFGICRMPKLLGNFYHLC